MSAARRSRNPLRWLERKLFTFYGPADVRDVDSTRAAPAPAPGGPETVVGETVHRDPGALGASGAGGADRSGADGAAGADGADGTGGAGGPGAGEVVRGELAPPAVGPARDAEDPTHPRP